MMQWGVSINIEQFFKLLASTQMAFLLLDNSQFHITISLSTCLVLQMASVHQPQNWNVSRLSKSHGISLANTRHLARCYLQTSSLISLLPLELIFLLMECSRGLVCLMSSAVSNIFFLQLIAFDIICARTRYWHWKQQHWCQQQCPSWWYQQSEWGRWPWWRQERRRWWHCWRAMGSLLTLRELSVSFDLFKDWFCSNIYINRLQAQTSCPCSWNQSTMSPMPNVLFSVWPTLPWWPDYFIQCFPICMPTCSWHSHLSVLLSCCNISCIQWSKWGWWHVLWAHLSSVWMAKGPSSIWLCLCQLKSQTGGNVWP